MRMYQILEDRIVEDNTEEIIGKKIMVAKEVGVGLEKGHFRGIIIIAGMTGTQAIVDQDQDQEQVQIEIELVVISVGNMTIS